MGSRTRKNRAREFMRFARSVGGFPTSALAASDPADEPGWVCSDRHGWLPAECPLFESDYTRMLYIGVNHNANGMTWVCADLAHGDLRYEAWRPVDGVIPLTPAAEALMAALRDDE